MPVEEITFTTFMESLWKKLDHTQRAIEGLQELTRTAIGVQENQLRVLEEIAQSLRKQD